MIPGIDVSRWNSISSGTLDGLAFAFARATYSTSIDPKYTSHVAAFRKAGLVVGAYTFGNGATSGAAQAHALLQVARDADLLVLDWEGDPNPMSEAQAREFIATVKAVGRTVGLYHSRSGFPSIGQDWNWVAQWGGTQPAIRWSFWQWQGSPLDRDWFNGDLAALRKLAGKPPPDTGTVQRVRVQGSFWNYSGVTPDGHAITRQSRTSNGFSASISPVIRDLNWGGKPRRFRRLTSSALAGQWVDLNNVPAVQLMK